VSTWVVGAVIANSLIRPTRVLAARRRDIALADGPWEFPGGKVEPGETPRDALVRELREELGIHVTIADEIDEPRCGWVISDSLRLRLFLAETTDTPQPGPDHDELAWLDVDRLESVHWMPVDREALTEVSTAIAGLSSGQFL
jgi:8-oxo-dGTP diphosphatase